MQGRHDIKMWPGAVSACALPVGLSLIFTAAFMAPEHRVNLFMTGPVLLCFIFGAPLSAWLACRRLRGIKDGAGLSQWGTSFGAGLLSASAVHFWASLIYTVGFALFAGFASGGVGEVEVFATLIIMSGLINLGLWCVLTLPFALICASIFWAVTKFPEEVSVF